MEVFQKQLPTHTHVHASPPSRTLSHNHYWLRPPPTPSDLIMNHSGPALAGKDSANWVLIPRPTILCRRGKRCLSYQPPIPPRKNHFPIALPRERCLTDPV